MKPSLSIIFFTVSSGAGLGLLALLGLVDLMTHVLPSTALVEGIVISLALVAAGLTSSRLSYAPRQAGQRVARVLAISHVVAVARGRLRGVPFPVAIVYGGMTWSEEHGAVGAALAMGVVVLSWAVLMSTTGDDLCRA